MAKEELAECKTPLYWHQCYKGTYDVISPSSFAHPAKMSPALCYRILQHLEELGLLKEGDKILDPMSGTGITNICAGLMGYPSISVELEEKFIGFQEQNKQYVENRTYKNLDWTMIKGDSRYLSSLLQGDGLKSVTSPPYENIEIGKGLNSKPPREGKHDQSGRNADAPSQTDTSYSDNPENIGNLKDTPLKSITSPPFEDSLPNGLDRKAAETMVRAMYEKHGRTYSKEDFEYQVELILKRSNREYGESEGQIGKLKDTPLKAVMSPPYGEMGIAGGDLEARLARLEEAGYTDIVRQYREGNPKARNFVLRDYGEAEGQIGKLKDTPLKSIMSPPYGETGVGDWKTGRAEFQEWVINEFKTKGYVEWQGKRYNEAEWRAMNHGRIDGRTTKGVHKHPTTGYSDADDNIGNLPDKPLKSVMSPPYGDAEKRDRSKEASNEKEKDYPRGDHNISVGYQGNEDNIGVLPDKPLKSVMSPPYDGHPSASNSDLHPERQQSKPAGRQYGNTPGQIGSLKSVVSPPYEDAKGDKHHSPRADAMLGEKRLYETYTERGVENVGNEKGESYLQAMLKVYAETLIVSDTIVTVVKNPTRDGKIRNLALDTFLALKLCHNVLYCNCETDYMKEGVQLDDAEWRIYKTLEEMGKNMLGVRVSHKQSFQNGEVSKAQSEGDEAQATYRGDESQDKGKAGITGHNPRTSGKNKRRFQADVGQNREAAPVSLRDMRETGDEGIQEMCEASLNSRRTGERSKKNIRKNEEVDCGRESSIPTKHLGKERCIESNVARGDAGEGKQSAKAQQSELAESTDEMSGEGQFHMSDMRRRGIHSSTQTGEGMGRGDIGVQHGRVDNTLPRVPHEDGRASQVCRICGKEKREPKDRIQWRINCIHRALLFEELEQPDLFGETQKKVKGRLSFFKRLSWQNGQPVAAWEDILIAVRK